MAATAMTVVTFEEGLLIPLSKVFLLPRPKIASCEKIGLTGSDAVLFSV